MTSPNNRDPYQPSRGSCRLGDEVKYVALIAAPLILAACSGVRDEDVASSFPHTPAELSSYPAALIEGELEIKRGGDSYCPVVSTEHGEDSLLVLPPSSRVDATRVYLSGKQIEPGIVSFGGGMLEGIEFNDAGCNGYPNVWLVAP